MTYEVTCDIATAAGRLPLHEGCTSTALDPTLCFVKQLAEAPISLGCLSGGLPDGSIGLRPSW